MIKLLKVGLVLSAIVAGPIMFFALIWYHWLFALPFLGCGLVAWYIGKSIAYLGKHAVTVKIISNILVNIGYSFNQRGGDELVERLALDPEVFKKNFQQRTAR